MQLGQQLRQQRLAHHLSQSQLAGELHLSRQSISKWENGTALPSFANVVAISELFNLTLDELIKGDPALMTQLKKGPMMRPVIRIILAGLGIGFVGWFWLNRLQIPMTAVESWLSLAELLGLVGLVITLNWRILNQALNKWAIIWGTLWLSALTIPTIYEFIIGFSHGYHAGH